MQRNPKPLPGLAPLAPRQCAQLRGGTGGNDTGTGGEGGTTGGNSNGGTGNTGGIPPPSFG